jgi:hypothetical protein
MWRLACTLVVLPFARSQDMESEVDLGFETNMDLLSFAHAHVRRFAEARARARCRLWRSFSIAVSSLLGCARI